MKFASLLAAAALASLAACASPAQKEQYRRGQQAEDFLEKIGPAGDPGSVAATDIAFARTAREDGAANAFRRFAASGALIHAAAGPLPYDTTGDSGPGLPESWSPREVWSSCDGTLAVTSGRFADPAGQVGDYATVWALQRDNSYRWSYDIGALDDPQPPPRVRPDPSAAGEDTIIVPGLDMIDGRVADCLRDGQSLPPRQPEILDGSVRSAAGTSRDGTLHWRWEHRADGTRRVVVDYLRQGAWERALDFAISRTD